MDTEHLIHLSPPCPLCKRKFTRVILPSTKWNESRDYLIHCKDCGHITPTTLEYLNTWNEQNDDKHILFFEAELMQTTPVCPVCGKTNTRVILPTASWNITGQYQIHCKACGALTPVTKEQLAKAIKESHIMIAKLEDEAEGATDISPPIH